MLGVSGSDSDAILIGRSLQRRWLGHARGLCCNGGIGTREGLVHCWSGSKNCELLDRGRVRIVGVNRLSLTHHVNHFDAGQDDGGTCSGKKRRDSH